MQNANLYLNDVNILLQNQNIFFKKIFTDSLSQNCVGNIYTIYLLTLYHRIVWEIYIQSIYYEEHPLMAVLSYQQRKPTNVN